MEKEEKQKRFQILKMSVVKYIQKLMLLATFENFKLSSPFASAQEF
jgi:hypothetical protein